MNTLKRDILWIWNNMAGIKINTLLRVLIGVSRVLLGLYFIYVSKHFIDVTAPHGTRKQIIMEILLLLTVTLVQLGIGQIQVLLRTRAKTYQTNTIRMNTFKHLFLRLMFNNTKQMHSGDLTSRLLTDVGVVADTTTSLIPNVVITTFQLIAAFIFMANMNLELALTLIVITPAFILLCKLISRKLKYMTKDIREQDSKIQSVLQEGLQHNVTLRSLESTNMVFGNLDGLQSELYNKVDKRTRFTIMTHLILSGTFSLGYLTAFIWGALEVGSGKITYGVMTAFLQLVTQIQRPILDLINVVPGLIHTSASIDRLVELENMPTEPEEDREILSGKVGVKVENVDFAYAPEDGNIFTDFSFDFKPGSHTAIVGRTGAGKTTLFRMLLALIKPSKGTLTVYNSTTKTPLDVSTRGNFVFVPQGNTLLSGTIRDNLRLGDPNATDEDMKKTLHTACADFVLDLPKGLDSRCGERGSGLSEGQAQRIAIARGLLRPGSILLLDEISSSLDLDTEREMFTRLFEAYPNKTMIFITHREKVGELCENRLHIGND